MNLRSLAIFGFLFPVICTAQSHYFQSIINTPSLHHQCSLFFDEVLRQGTAEQFFAHVDTYGSAEQLSDAAWYERLYADTARIKPSVPFIARYKTLRYQQKLLGAQIQSLLPQGRTWDGVLEIGTPGTYIAALHGNVSLQGPRIVVCDQSGPTNYIQAWTGQISRFGIAYDKHMPLADYAPLSDTIPDASLDLVICVIGLHHIPDCKIEPFVSSIARVLRPGGIFILRDHDCTDDDTYTLAYGAHMIFNLLIGDADPADEVAELRNFQPLEHWITLLARHGLYAGSERILQERDTTRNTFIACTKKATDAHTAQKQAAHELAMTGGKRALFQTYMTTSEWISVELANQEAQYGVSRWHQFPYLKSIALLWSSFKNSWNLSRIKSSRTTLLASDYTLMNLFICSMTTTQYLLRAGVFKTLHYVAPHTDGLVHRAIDEQYKAYGAWIYHTPFYDFHYWQALRKMWSAYGKDFKTRRFADKCNDGLWATAQSIEYILNGSLSALVGCAYSAEQSVTERIQIVVRDPENYVAQHSAQYPNVIQLLATYPDSLKRLSVPRYMPFQQVIQDLTAHQIQIVSIAGNTEMQCKVRYKNDITANWALDGCTFTSQWKLPGDTTYTYVNCTVAVDQLHTIIPALQKQGIEIVYCHDF
jgi:SAM-dependent methyltransferase